MVKALKKLGIEGMFFNKIKTIVFMANLEPMSY
jgi:hypothetical protein